MNLDVVAFFSILGQGAFLSVHLKHRHIEKKIRNMTKPGFPVHFFIAYLLSSICLKISYYLYKCFKSGLL